ncbi:MAG: hypothetical protein Q7J31_00085, partial [Syntrophales bacterium]|nr:hypothetical protein [Syntrophales bacterium]
SFLRIGQADRHTTLKSCRRNMFVRKDVRTDRKPSEGRRRLMPDVLRIPYGSIPLNGIILNLFSDVQYNEQ